MYALADIGFVSAVKAAAGSSLAATLAAFALILVLTRLRVPLAVSILAGAAAVGVLFHRPAGRIAAGAWHGAVAPQTLGLVFVVVTMLALTELMRRARQLDRIVELARSLLRRPAVTMAAMPALIGLLPMPGGAQLSAPMVEAAAGGMELSPGRLSAVNYWFRHIWEHWWPLYPGVIVAMSLTKSDVMQFAVWQIPLGIFMAAAGLPIFRGSHPDLHKASPRPPAAQAWKLLKATSSIWAILLAWGVARAVLLLAPPHAAEGEAMAAVRRFGPLGFGLLASLVWTAWMNRMSLGQAAGVLKTRSIYRLAVAVVGVMVFWQAVQDADAARRIAAELADLGVPAGVVAAVLPLVAGLVTGLAVGFVGTSFPIVLAVVAAAGQGNALRAYVALAYAYGHLGQMLSPLHICQIVSNEYFQARPADVYRRIAVPAVLTAAAGTAYFLAVRAILE